MLRYYGLKAWNGFNWLWIWHSGGLFRCRKSGTISWTATCLFAWNLL